MVEQKVLAKQQLDKIEKVWSGVLLSRHPQRPYTGDYLAKLFDDYECLRGDQLFGEDEAITGGIARINNPQNRKKDLKLFFLGHQKGRNTQEKIKRNFGMAQPEGYRKAMRVMELAEKFKMPLLTFIDTPGAYPGIEAEKHGQFSAIAKSTLKMLNLQTPTLGLVIGEGGSGGALAIGVPDRLLMLKNSTYSVISPESCASILWSDPSYNKKAALALKANSKNLHKLKICDEIIPEAKGGALLSNDKHFENVKERIIFHLNDLKRKKVKTLLKKRYLKYRYVDKEFFT